MPEIAEILPQARKYRSLAVETLLQSYYPTVHRIAYALCGEEKAARDVVNRVLSQSLPALPKWRDDSAADRWFYHYTVLETRQHETSGSSDDPLLPRDSVNHAYTAFIRAFRAMPLQQREAIVLNHGEHLNPRYLGVAMDCSAEAAANHLRVATLYLRSIAGEQAEELLGIFAKVYHQLSPPSKVSRPIIERRINRFLFPRRLKRLLLLFLLLAGILAAVWTGHRWGLF